MLDKARVVMINKSWIPLKVIPLKRAIVMLFSPQIKSNIVCPKTLQLFSWSDWATIPVKDDDRFIQSTSQRFLLPEIIILLNYNKIPKRSGKFTKRAMFQRDDHRCQYCGNNNTPLTVDHILPKSRNGKTTWHNCVAACPRCNKYKHNRTPEEAGMTLIKEPTDFQVDNHELEYCQKIFRKLTTRNQTATGAGIEGP